MNDKMRDLADMTASEKRDLLASLLQDSSGPTVSNLSLEQQRLWFLHKLDPSVPWHVAAGLRITGEFDLAALQQAVSQVMQRHESLRSTFVEVNGQPLRGSAPVTGFPISVVELGGGVLGDVVRGEFGGGFDVGVGPLVRVLVVRCGVGVHVVVVTLHQLVADRVSLGLFVGEFVGVYGSLVSGAAGDSAGDGAVSGAGDGGGGVGFGDVVGWQREWLGGGEAVGEVEFWRGWLGGVGAFDFPSDGVRPGVKSFRGVGCGVWCGEGFVSGVGGLAARLGVDPWVVLLAGWGLVLARCSGVADFAVGVGLGGGWRLAGGVGGGGQWGGAARLRGRVPFERIVEAVGPGRDLSRSPLFQVFFGSEREREWGFGSVPGAG